MTERERHLECDLDELTAWIDGQLAGGAPQRVAGLVAADPAWKAACEELRAVDALLGALPEPPAPSAGLTDRIVAAAYGRQRVFRIYAAVASVAAAACLALALWVGLTRGPTPGPAVAESKGVEKVINDALKDVDKDDRPIVVNLPLFKNYSEVKAYAPVSTVADADTISALAELEPDKTR